ncbi:MAG: hypothetical protein JNK74_02430 [Candidatus Hydrogenedentes bacterium]|nr:hypothetical protein [Candidatus Hydrogenedentota bacterium]
MSKVKVRPIWEIERFKVEGEPRIKLTVFQTRKGRDGHAIDFILDPERDFQAVHVLVWETFGVKKLEEHQRTLQELTDGRWFPSKVTVRKEDECIEREFSNVEFNVDLDPSIFTFQSFEAGASTIMQRKNLNGTDTIFLLRGGQWVPASMVPR